MDYELEILQLQKRLDDLEKELFEVANGFDEFISDLKDDEDVPECIRLSAEAAYKTFFPEHKFKI